MAPRGGPLAIEWTLSPLRPDTEYLVSVVALAWGGEAEPSLEAALRTTQPRPPQFVGALHQLQREGSCTIARLANPRPFVVPLAFGLYHLQVDL